MLRANQLRDADVLAMRQALKQAIIDRRMAKRADLAQVNAALDAEVRSLISQGNDEVERLNDIHQELVLSILEAVDYYGEEADIKLILTQAGEGGIDIYGGQDVKALYREDREGTLEYQRYSSGYTRPTYGY